TGGRYDPATDKWTDITMNGAPSVRWEHSAVWTGESMIVFGGGVYSGYPTGTFLYTPTQPVFTDWTSLDLTNTIALGGLDRVAITFFGDTNLHYSVIDGSSTLFACTDFSP